MFTNIFSSMQSSFSGRISWQKYISFKKHWPEVPKFKQGSRRLHVCLNGLQASFTYESRMLHTCLKYTSSMFQVNKEYNCQLCYHTVPWSVYTGQICADTQSGEREHCHHPSHFGSHSIYHSWRHCICCLFYLKHPKVVGAARIFFSSKTQG